MVVDGATVEGVTPATLKSRGAELKSMRRGVLLDLSVTLLLAPFVLAGALLIYLAFIDQTAYDGLDQIFLSVSKNPYLFFFSVALTLAGTAILVKADDATSYVERLRTSSSLLMGLGVASALLAYLVALSVSGNLGVASQLMVEGRFFSVYPLILFLGGLLLRVPRVQDLKFKSLLEPLLALLALPIFVLMIAVSGAGLGSLLFGILFVVLLFWALERYWK